MGKLYLIPNLLSENNWEDVLPVSIKTVCLHTRYFIVENIRTTRRFLKKLDKSVNIDEITFFELNKRTTEIDMQKSMEPLLNGFNMGIISEAGCPGVADPGAEIVKLAHQHNIQVVPLVGPSSILLALMASGLNGQSFAFVGYLPVKPNERIKRIKQLEIRAKSENQTQIFIETPYRNNQMAEGLIRSCSPATLLCIACDITSKDEWIVTKTVKDWGRSKLPDLNKRPSIFMIL